MALIQTEIDGRQIEVERDRWALGVARDMGIDIPTLCHHPALEPYGACRLCVVEVTQGKWTWLTTACDLPIREGLSIRTDSPAVIKARKMTLELLWAQAPDAAEVEDLARQLGVTQPRFGFRAETGKCILCGLCDRVCEKILGQSAISFTRRGADRMVGTPFGASADTCNGCGACVAICPTGHIQCVDDGPIRRMETWNTELELARCEQCGAPIAPAMQLEAAKAKLPDHVPVETICHPCRRAKTVARLRATGTAG